MVKLVAQVVEEDSVDQPVKRKGYDIRLLVEWCTGCATSATEHEAPASII